MLKNQINQISRIRNELFQISIKSENPFWDKVLKFLNYINKLDPEDLELIELHISFFGGKNPFSYWHADSIEMNSRVEKELSDYSKLIKGIPEKYHLSSPFQKSLPEQRGHYFKSEIINSDILRYQNFVTNAYLTNNMKAIKDSIVVEIGSGYGGLALQLLRKLEVRKCILVDLPQTLCIAGTYLTVLSKDIKVSTISNSNDLINALENNHEVMLLPSHLFLNDAKIIDLLSGKIGLVINQLSFQEMKSSTVAKYTKISSLISKQIYSENWIKHFANDDIENVGNLVSRHFRLLPNVGVYRKVKDLGLYKNNNSQQTQIYWGYSKQENIPHPLSGSVRVSFDNFEVKYQNIDLKNAPKLGNYIIRKL
jgi:putative sugar O-methyltransferase